MQCMLQKFNINRWDTPKLSLSDFGQISNIVITAQYLQFQVEQGTHNPSLCE
jgi:hypothetical protein